MGGIEQRHGVEKVRNLQHRSGSFDLREPTFRIGQCPKSKLSPGSQPFPRFSNQCKFPIQPRAILRKRHRIERPLPRRARRPPKQQFAQLVELQNFLCRSRHKIYFPSFAARWDTASSCEAATCTNRPFASPHGAGCPNSTSRTRSRTGVQKSPNTANGFPPITDLFNISQTTASSTSVPVPPLHATKPSANRINSNKRSCHVFIRTSTSIHAFAFGLKNSAVTPYVFPPDSFAPRETASITPPYPPLQMANPARASSVPNKRASA